MYTFLDGLKDRFVGERAPSEGERAPSEGEREPGEPPHDEQIFAGYLQRPEQAEHAYKCYADSKQALLRNPSARSAAECFRQSKVVIGAFDEFAKSELEKSRVEGSGIVQDTKRAQEFCANFFYYHVKEMQSKAPITPPFLIQKIIDVVQSFFGD